MAKEVPSIIKTVNKILTGFLGAHDSLKKQPGTDIWKLRGNMGSYTTQDEKEGGIVIWPFPVKAELEKQAASYPFYFSLSIILEATEKIKELNIRLFKEDRSQPTKADIKPTELLLRAEWVNDISGDHAQPHWHIHSYNVIDKLSEYSPETQRSILALLEDEPVATSIEQLMEINEPGGAHQQEEVNGEEQTKLPVFKFHLSMISDWDREQSKSQCKNLDSTNIKLWLPQCLAYIKTQIEYLLRKVPAI